LCARQSEQDLQPTVTLNNQPQKLAEFETLTEALDYAATGETGYNFYDSRGRLQSVLSYKELKRLACINAQRLLGMDIPRG